MKEQHKQRISELEKQITRSQNSVSPTKLKFELNENVELIKLKRLSKKQAAQILSLQSQLELSSAELKQLQTNLLAISNDKGISHIHCTFQNRRTPLLTLTICIITLQHFVDHVQMELSSEKCENAKLLSDISTLKENSKFLEEQINDLQVTLLNSQNLFTKSNNSRRENIDVLLYVNFLFQKEKITLKEHNENLLKLSLQQNSFSSDSNKSNFSKQVCACVKKKVQIV